MMRLCAALIAALLPLAVEAQGPLETIEEITALGDDPDAIPEIEALVNAALAEARTQGPLELDWVATLTIGGFVMANNSCNYRRGFQLLDEASLLADFHQSGVYLEFNAAWRAYLLTMAGLTERAAAELGRISTTHEDYLSEGFAAQMGSILADPPPVVASPMLEVCYARLRDIEAQMEAGDVLGAEKAYFRLGFPEEFEDEPDILVFNVLAEIAYSVALDWRDQAAAESRVAAIIEKLAIPGSDLPRPRPILFESSGGTEQAAVIFRHLSSRDAAAPHADTARRWLEPFLTPGASGAPEVADIGEAVLAAKKQFDYPRVLSLLDEYLARDDLSAADRAYYTLRRAVESVFAGLQSGDPIPDADIIDISAAIWASETMPAFTKLTLSFEMLVISSLSAAPDTRLALAEELIVNGRRMMRAEAVSGSGSGVLRVMSDLAPHVIEPAFEDALASAGNCIESVRGPICTVRLSP